MENVPEMGLGANAIIIRQVISALEAAGYDVHTRMLSAWQFGVPQRRQRLILVGVRNKVKFHWPRRFRDTAVTVRNEISDLSEVKAGSKTFVVPYHDTKILAKGDIFGAAFLIAAKENFMIILLGLFDQTTWRHFV